MCAGWEKTGAWNRMSRKSEQASGILATCPIELSLRHTQLAKPRDKRREAVGGIPMGAALWLPRTPYLLRRWQIRGLLALCDTATESCRDDIHRGRHRAVASPRNQL